MFLLFPVQVGKFFLAKFLNGFGQNFLIRFVSQIGDKSALFGAQQVSCAANIQILHRDMYAAAQFRKVLNGLQAPARIGAERVKRRSHQVAERFAIASPNASAKLVQVAQSEVLRVDNNDSVHIGHIDSRFDNGGGQQHIVFVIQKIGNNGFQLFRIHLPVRHSDANIANFAFKQRFHLINILNAVVDDKNLSVAAHFVIDGFFHHFHIECMHFGLHRIAVGRGSINGGKIARTHQRKLQRARNGRGGHRECIDIAFQLFKFFFNRHAKLLFFVDDEQTQIVELNVFSHQPMRSDDNIYFPVFQFG